MSFSSLSAHSLVLPSKYNFETALNLLLFGFSRYELRNTLSWFWYHILLTNHQRLTLPVTLWCSVVQNGCLLHDHAANRVLTSGCSVISQQIWNEIVIVIAIIGVCIKIEKLRVGKRIMNIHISGWHTFNVGTLSYLIVTSWHTWHSGRGERRFSWRCSHSFAPLACLWILCSAIVSWKAAVHFIFTNDCKGSFYRSLHLSMPRKLNSPLLLFLHLGVGFLHQGLWILYCGARKPLYRHFGHHHRRPHVGLFSLYPTCLPCNGSWDVKSLPEMDCCFPKWDSAITPTIYDSVTSSKLLKSCQIPSQRELWRYLSPSSWNWPYHHGCFHRL